MFNLTFRERERETFFSVGEFLSLSRCSELCPVSCNKFIYSFEANCPPRTLGSSIIDVERKSNSNFFKGIRN